MAAVAAAANGCDRHTHDTLNDEVVEQLMYPAELPRLRVYSYGNVHAVRISEYNVECLMCLAGCPPKMSQRTRCSFIATVPG